MNTQNVKKKSFVGKNCYRREEEEKNKEIDLKLME